MTFYWLFGILLFSTLFYTLGRYDGDAETYAGLIIWAIVNITMLIWMTAKLVYTGE